MDNYQLITECLKKAIYFGQLTIVYLQQIQSGGSWFTILQALQNAINSLIQHWLYLDAIIYSLIHVAELNKINNNISELYLAAEMNTAHINILVKFIRLADIKEKPELALVNEKKILESLLEIDTVNFTGERIDQLLSSYSQVLQVAYRLFIVENNSYTRWREDYSQRQVDSLFFDSVSYGNSVGAIDYIGITDAFRALRNYHKGAEKIAEWLTQEFASQFNVLLDISGNIKNSDRPKIYEIYRKVIGRVEIRRSNLNAQAPSGAGDQPGYTTDHRIYDRFDVARTKPMPWELFLHELSHVFINSAGYGLVDFSPLDGNESITFQNCNDLGCVASQILDGNTNALRYPFEKNHPAGNEENGTNKREIVANLIQNAALRYVQILNDQILKLILYRSLVVNMVRNTTPSAMQQILGSSLARNTKNETLMYISFDTPIDQNLEYPILSGTSVNLYRRSPNNRICRIRSEKKWRNFFRSL
jgi:hypothetical protein